MFKTDKHSLEKLSFIFSEKDIARFKRLFELVSREDMSTVPAEELERLFHGLNEIGRLKLDAKHYAFHVEDEYAYKQGGDAGYGVEVYLRQGDALENELVLSHRDYVMKANELIPILNERKITRLYTGPIPKGTSFLGLPEECDPDDPLIRSILHESEIIDFRDAGIEVILLETLI
ncbi:hypothetical protein HYZ97_01545 [Candidatus Pacearchaeota archaeon]|nr:hypothetical protein [Candidatus Pacearchaeota archaeon]